MKPSPELCSSVSMRFRASPDFRLSDLREHSIAICLYGEHRKSPYNCAATEN